MTAPISRPEALRLHELILEMNQYRAAGPLGDNSDRLSRFNRAYDEALAILAPHTEPLS